MILKQKQNNCFSSFWNPPNYVSPPTYKHTLMEVVIVAFSPLFLFFFSLSLSFLVLFLFHFSIMIIKYLHRYCMIKNIERSFGREPTTSKRERTKDEMEVFFSFLSYFASSLFRRTTTFLCLFGNTHSKWKEIYVRAPPLFLSRFLSSCWTT